MQAWAYATFGRGANLTGGPLSQSTVQQQPLGMFADIVRANGSPLSTERLADHGRDKNKEQTPSMDCRGDGKRLVVKQLTVCVDTTAPRNCPVDHQRGRREVRPRLAWRVMHDPRISRPPYFLIEILS